jgi:hypothetical protein
VHPWVSFWERFIDAIEYSHTRRGTVFEDVVYFPLDVASQWDPEIRLRLDDNDAGELKVLLRDIKDTILDIVGENLSYLAGKSDPDDKSTWIKGFHTLEAGYLYLIRARNRRYKDRADLPPEVQGYTAEVID